MNLYKTNHAFQDHREPEPTPKGSLFKGLAFAILATAAFCGLAFMGSQVRALGIFMGAFLFIGVVQILWIIPLIYRYRRQSRTVQGILIGAGLVFLLNGACFALVMTTFSH